MAISEMIRKNASLINAVLRMKATLLNVIQPNRAQLNSTLQDTAPFGYDETGISCA